METQKLLCDACNHLLLCNVCSHCGKEVYALEAWEKIKQSFKIAPQLFWLTGLPSAGKTTIAKRMFEFLSAMGINCAILDGDLVREKKQNFDFSKSGRSKHIRSVGIEAQNLVNEGKVVIASFISPYREDRRYVRSLFAIGKFIEVFVLCPLNVCMQRDVKGLYKKAQNGEISNLTGVNDPYEEPLGAEVAVCTDINSVDVCVVTILNVCSV